MIRVYELKTEEDKKKAKAKFSVLILEFCRVFLMQDIDANQDIGIGVLQLDGAEVYIKYICVPDDDKPFEYFDLLARSLLNVLRDMFGLRILLDSSQVNAHCKKDGCPAKNKNDYWRQFGFKEYADGVLSVISHEIDLKGACKG